jgi:CRP/FNR family transcriptional regulator
MVGATIVDAPAGTRIFSEDGPRRPAAVLDGLVRGFIWTPAGRQVTVRYIRSGDLVGLVPLLGGAPTWNAEAALDTRLALLPVDVLRDRVLRHPSLAWTVVEALSAIAVDAVVTVAAAGSQPVQTRVSLHLLELAVETPDGRSETQVTHQQLADAVGSAREVVTRSLRNFRERGFIATHPGRIAILAPEALASIAGEGGDPGE